MTDRSACATLVRDMARCSLDAPWWQEEAIRVREDEDPASQFPWDLEFEAPMIPSEALAELLLNGDKRALPWWAVRDGGFLVKDRSLRVGFATWTPEQRAAWNSVQRAFVVPGYSYPAKKVWAFEDLTVFWEVFQTVLLRIQHPKGIRWAGHISRWLREGAA